LSTEPDGPTPAETGVEPQPDWKQGLEGKAVEVAANAAKRQCIQAGPGTGKTKTLMHKILRLVLQDRVDPDRILAVSFTRTAAQDLRRSLNSLSSDVTKKVHAGTLHGIATEIVSSQGFLQAYDLVFRPLLTASKSSNLGYEAAPMLADLAAHGNATDLSRNIRDFEAYWARNQGSPLGPAPKPELQDFENDLLSWVRFHRCMLIGQVIPLAVQYLQSEPEAPFRKRFDHVLVDEYQDLNRAEQELCELLVGDSGSTVVGDADQSIYAFKCAEAQGLLDYAQRADVATDNLDECRRCPPTVVGLANSTVSRNKTRASVQMQAVSPRAGQIFYRRYAALEDEAKGVSGFINEVVTKGGIEIGATLVLCPARVLGRMIRDSLREDHGLEATSYFYEEALEERPAQRAFAVLRLLSDRKDRTALRFLFGYNRNNPENSTWRVGEYAKLRSHCEASNVEPWEAMCSIADGTLVLVGTSSIAAEFAVLKAELDGLQGKTAQQVLDALFPPGEDWAEDARTAAGEYIAEDVTIPDLYENMLTEITQPVMPTEVTHVRIMSLHRSKGLTADAVAICGCVHGLLPRLYNEKKTVLDEDGHREEQRRLFYVALTRTRDFLLISSAQAIPRDVAHKMGLGELLRLFGPLRTTVSSFVTDLQPSLPTVSASMEFLR